MLSQSRRKDILILSWMRSPGLLVTSNRMEITTKPSLCLSVCLSICLFKLPRVLNEQTRTIKDAEFFFLNKYPGCFLHGCQLLHDSQHDDTGTLCAPQFGGEGTEAYRGQVTFLKVTKTQSPPATNSVFFKVIVWQGFSAPFNSNHCGWMEGLNSLPWVSAISEPSKQFSFLLHSVIFLLALTKVVILFICVQIPASVLGTKHRNAATASLLLTTVSLGTGQVQVRNTDWSDKCMFGRFIFTNNPQNSWHWDLPPSLLSSLAPFFPSLSLLAQWFSLKRNDSHLF